MHLRTSESMTSVHDEQDTVKNGNDKRFLLTSTLCWIEQRHYDRLSSLYDLLDSKESTESKPVVKPTATLISSFRAFVTSNDSNVSYQTVHNSSHFLCQICGKTFSRKSSYERHQKNVHFNVNCTKTVNAAKTISSNRKKEIIFSHKVHNKLSDCNANSLKRKRNFQDIDPISNKNTRKTNGVISIGKYEGDKCVNVNVERKINKVMQRTDCSITNTAEESPIKNRPVTRNKVQITLVKKGSTLAKKSTGGGMRNKGKRSTFSKPNLKEKNALNGPSETTKGHILKESSAKDKEVEDESTELLCWFCPKRFKKTVYYDRHQKVHIKNKKKGLSAKSKSDNLSSNLKSNKKNYQQKNPVTNSAPTLLLRSVCLKTFKRKVSYERHEKQHLKKKTNLTRRSNIKISQRVPSIKKAKLSTKCKSNDVKDKQRKYLAKTDLTAEQSSNEKNGRKSKSKVNKSNSEYSN